MLLHALLHCHDGRLHALHAIASVSKRICSLRSALRLRTSILPLLA